MKAYYLCIKVGTQKLVYISLNRIKTGPRSFAACNKQGSAGASGVGLCITVPQSLNVNTSPSPAGYQANGNMAMGQGQISNTVESLYFVGAQFSWFSWIPSTMNLHPQRIMMYYKQKLK